MLLVPPWDHATVKLYPVAEAVEDPSKMLVNELRRGFSCITEWLRVRDDRPLQVRPDFGVGLVASVFGVRVEVVKNDPPWVHPLEGDNVEASITKILDDLDVSRSETCGWLPRVVETLDYYTEVFSQYPRVASCIAITLPDLQGPFDTTAMVWGNEILPALLTEPELIERLLGAISLTMVHLHDSLRRWVGRELLPEGFSHQHGAIIRGNLLLRSDHNVMVNPHMYAAQIFVHDRHVLGSVGKGGFHSCGCWKHNIPTVLQAEDVESLDFGAEQSHL